MLRFLLLLAVGLVGPASAQMKVVATVPDLADIVREIGGDRVEVFTIAKGRENLHAVRLKPSHVVAVSRADVFVQVGLSLEHAWVPGLLEKARNRTIQPGGAGLVTASAGWEPIQVPERLDRSQAACVHPEGNPHMNLSPTGGPHIAGNILEALIRLDPAGEASFRKRHDAWFKRYEEAAKGWARIQEALKGQKVVQSHQEFDYLLEACGIEQVGMLEPRPGLPPTGRHLAGLIKTMRTGKVPVLLTAPAYNDRNVAKVASETGATALELPSMVNGVTAATGWIELMTLLHQGLAEAYGVGLADGVDD